MFLEHSARQPRRWTKNGDNAHDPWPWKRGRILAFPGNICVPICISLRVCKGGGSSSSLTALVKPGRPVAFEIMWVFSEIPGCAEEKGPVDFSGGSDCVVQ